MAIRTLSDTVLTARLDAIHFFVNFDGLNRCISVKTSLINTKLGNLLNPGVLILTMWINSNCC